VIRPGHHVEIRKGVAQVVPPTKKQRSELSRVVVSSPSKHGITYMRPDDAPEEWVDELFAALIEEHLQIGLGVSDRIPWREAPAISLVPATRMEAIGMHPDNRPYSRIEVTTPLLGGLLVNAHPPAQWHDPDTGRPVTFNLEGDTLDLDYRRPRTIELQVRRNIAASPGNALTHQGEPIGPRTFGLLTPAPTVATSVQLIGRESRQWRDGRGILKPPETKVYLTKTDIDSVAALIRNHYWWRGAAPLIAERTGLSVRTVRSMLAGQPPSPRSAERLWEFAYQQRLFAWHPGESEAPSSIT
jgi:hypothetical protein